MDFVRAQPKHACEISRLLRVCYGDSYTKPALYDPDRLAAMLTEGSLVSVLALDGDRVVGHYALEIDLPPTLAMTGMALVDPDARGGGLMHRLREHIETLASELGLEAIYGTAVTAHPRSQAAYDRLGNVPTGLLLGLPGRLEFQNLKTERQSGISLVHYYKPLRPAQVPALFCPAPYLWLLTSIGDALGYPRTFRTLRRGRKGGFEPAESGLGSPRALWREGAANRAEADWIDFPLEKDGWLEDFEQARQAGYRFAALVPLTAEGRFRLRMHPLPTDFDGAALALHHPLAATILNFILEELL